MFPFCHTIARTSQPPERLRIERVQGAAAVSAGCARPFHGLPQRRTAQFSRKEAPRGNGKVVPTAIGKALDDDSQLPFCVFHDFNLSSPPRIQRI